MSPRLGYPNARSVAYAVKRELDSKGWSPLSARPWNMRQPDSTFWWLVPATEWPAYKYGKLFFSPDRAPRGCLFCGLHVEKGLGPSAAPAYQSAKGQRYIMRDDWTWHTFLKNLPTTELRSAIYRAYQETDTPVVIRLEAGPVDDPEYFDPYATRPKYDWDLVVFKTTGDSMQLEFADTPARLLMEVADCRKLDDLNGAIPEIPGRNWVWLDFLIGTVLERYPQDSDPNCWNAEQLWRNALSVWEPWFR